MGPVIDILGVSTTSTVTVVVQFAAGGVDMGGVYVCLLFVTVLRLSCMCTCVVVEICSGGGGVTFSKKGSPKLWGWVEGLGWSCFVGR